MRCAGPVVEWLCSGLQIRVRRFDSGPGLQHSLQGEPPMTTRARAPLSAYSFILLGLTLLTASLFSLPKPDLTDKSTLSGEATRSYEEAFEEHLPAKDFATGLWGAMGYGLFNTAYDGAIIGKNGWLFTKEEFTAPAPTSEQLAKRLNQIIAINNYLEANNAHLIVVLVPSKADIYSDQLPAPRPDYWHDVYDQSATVLLASSVNMPHLRRLFEIHTPAIQLYHKTDTHWTTDGATITAEAVARAFAPHHIDIGMEPFRATAQKPQALEGDLLTYVPTGIFAPWLAPEAELQTTYLTENPKASSAGLFGEQNIHAALVGTSYSAREDLHFLGALKVALQADVANWAEEGKGPMEPMAHFLRATDFSKREAPSLVIWEIPERSLFVPYEDVRFDMLEGVQ